MGPHVCPWWGGCFLASPLRRIIHRPETILGPFLRPGMAAVDIGCGMGFFTLPMARMVGPSGRVVAVDVQPKMLKFLLRRARRERLAGRIEPRLSMPGRPMVGEAVDFALAFWAAHEFPDTEGFAREAHGSLKPGGRLLLVEPTRHVSREEFEATVGALRAAGLDSSEGPPFRFSRSAVLERSGRRDTDRGEAEGGGAGGHP